MKRLVGVTTAVLGAAAIVLATTGVANAAEVNVPNSSGQCHYQSYDPGTINSSVNGSAYYWCVNLGPATGFSRLFSMKITRNGVDVGESTSTLQNINKNYSLSKNVTCVHGAKYQVVSQVVLTDLLGDRQVVAASYSGSYVMC